jgi:tartrate dehydrogenase/decarboxylase/D-malate dehydrogenase
MLDHLGRPDAARAVEDTIAAVTVAGASLTPDLGGAATTARVGDAIAAALAGR